MKVRGRHRASRTSLPQAKWPGSICWALSQLAWTHAHETLIWASKGRRARHTFNYNLMNSPNPQAQVSSVWRIPTVPKVEKLHGYHPTQKPLRLVRRALLASTREGDLVFDPFTGSGTTAVTAKELNRAFVGAELEEEFAKLAERRIRATRRASLLREISEQFCTIP
jgi:site-specific DNA-methyltransferase (adenine-specific)